MNTYSIVVENLKCLIPCERTSFKLKDVIRYSNFKETAGIGDFWQDDNSTVVGIRFHFTSDVKYISQSRTLLPLDFNLLYLLTLQVAFFCLSSGSRRRCTPTMAPTSSATWAASPASSWASHSGRYGDTQRGSSPALLSDNLSLARLERNASRLQRSNEFSILVIV